MNLFESVIEEECNVRVGNGVIEFHLIKEYSKIWGQIQSPTCTKDKAASKREEAIRISQQREQDLMEKNAKIKRDEERFAIRQEMKLEQEKRDSLEKEKKVVMATMMNNVLNNFFLQEETIKAMEKLQIDDSNFNTTDIWTGKTMKAPPAPRPSGKILFHFTPRPFSTAARESKIEEEEEWLSKMAAARRIQSSGNKEESANDRNPEFIKDKANRLFKAGDYDGAINALSNGIELNPNLPSLFANRAACYLKLGNNDRCIQDCSRALELYYPVIPSNLVSRAKVFVRRGAAFANNGDTELSLQDYSAALQLTPDNTTIQDDYKRLKVTLLAKN